MSKSERLALLMSKTKPTGACLFWTGAFIQNYNYKLGITSYKSKHWLAHRLSFYLTTGIHPGKKFVMHSCDNGLCINPEHLSLGTAKDNMQDMVRKNRHSGAKITHCPHGHEYTKENTLIWKSRKTSKTRACRECKRLASQRYRDNKRLLEKEGK